MNITVLVSAALAFVLFALAVFLVTQLRARGNAHAIKTVLQKFRNEKFSYSLEPEPIGRDNQPRCHPPRMSLRPCRIWNSWKNSASATSTVR